MLELGILGKNFPQIGQFHQPAEEVQASSTGRQDGICNCPQRESVPELPSDLPFSPTEENNDKMKEWLLERYQSSTFNTCPHSPLPAMIGPPIEMHVDELAKPKTCHTAAPVALHWQEQVHKDLLRDEALGVIEKVPYGEPVSWCHRMVVTRKADGSPRRTVDLSPLNKFCKRETFSAESPFPLARRIPGKTWKSVMDAWNGYHSVPLRESDRHLTTFITPFGRWRYTRAPKGYLSSGDGYNRRFDAILSNFERKERCVDDTIFYDDDLASHWWRAMEFLTTCGKAGIVLNPKKFQFCSKEVDFAGFKITEDKILPLPKYIEAIRAFPRPTSTTDIRSWFGLINRVANYAQLRDTLRLFKPFLSPKYKFFWTDTLDKAFEESKDHIVKAILKGVEIFDVNRPTCLRPDWSKRGIGYLLLQKHCDCSSEIPDCCENGWRITLAGSRFLKGPEQRYAAIEGEALAIVWGLEQTKYFTQGCPNLQVITDHKPLTKIFGDRTLDEISNTRLFRLKQKTLPWFFNIAHMPGKTNCAADAMSRYPVDCSTDSPKYPENEEEHIVAAICRDVSDVTTISWENIASETAKDSSLSPLLCHIMDNNSSVEINKEFKKYIEGMYACDGVLMYQDRVVIPKVLRSTVLKNLHAAHQGVSSMQERASAIMFWPGMSEDIYYTRAKCADCNINAPSQAQMPSLPATPPATPFEMIFADFFDFAGHHYLIIGDRLSGWQEIFQTPKGSSQSGSKGLISCLRKVFASFGVPEELSSDGGPEFSAYETQTFLAKWGVRHRKSSAYHPQSNGRAEVAVKSAKRLLRSNIGTSGTLDSDKFLRGMMQLRNTPDPDCKLSPSQILFGKQLRDAFGFVNRLGKYNNQAINPIWREAWQMKEHALRTRFIKTSEKINNHAKDLARLEIGDRCFIQNQTGPHPKKWDRTGVVMEVNPHDQYVIRVDGSGRLTARNRKYLRKFQTVSMEIQPAPPTIHIRDDIILPTHENYVPPPIHQQSDADSTPQGNVIDNNIPTDAVMDEPSLQNKEVSRRLPAVVRRLLPHNSEGLTEQAQMPCEEGRKLRNRIVQNL